MEHPLLGLDQKELRKRVTSLLRNNYSVARESNIVFVCGGNEDTHMRPQFRNFCEDQCTEFVFFQPEFAMESLFAHGMNAPFDISDFESLIGDLSQAIVIFPEAPGSFAETGYFSAKDDLAKKSILIMDAKYQKESSFISMGPAKKIGQLSMYGEIIQLNYEKPSYDWVITRLKERKTRRNLKALKWEQFKDLSKYELFCLISQVVHILSIATIEDIKFILRALFSGHLAETTVHQLTAILVGASYLEEASAFGHFKFNMEKETLLRVREGAKDDENEIRLQLAAIYQNESPDFKKLVEGM